MTNTDATQPSPSLIRRMLGSAGKLLLACADLYALGVIVYFLLRWLTGYSLWPVVLAGNLIHLYLLPSLAILPILLILRRWRRAALAGIPVLVFLWLYGGMFLPRVTPSCEDCIHLRVMTYNLGDGGTNTSPEVIASMLLESDADVIGLQEVTAEQAAAAQSEMIDEYPYQILFKAGESTHGVGILSRYPILEGEPFYGNPPTMPDLDVTLSIQGRPLHVLVVHPPPPGWSRDLRQFYRSRALEDVRLYVRLIGDQPAVLLGDLNSSDQSPEYATLTGAGLHDAYREAGFGFGLTFPVRAGYGYPFEHGTPLVRLDYILYTDSLMALRAWVGPDGGSDHMPVLADLAWKVDSAGQ